MAGRIRFQDYIKRSDLKANPNVLYVFGDNLAERGYGGQAKEMRGEPNAVGIPTKRFPSMNNDAFFSDNDIDEVWPIIFEKFKFIQNHLSCDGDVVFPSAGIGTGLAQLETRAPDIGKHLDNLIRHFFLIYAEK